MAWGVRSRVTLVATAIVLVVLALTGAALVAAQRAVLTDNVDEALERRIADIAQLIDDGTLNEVIEGAGDEESFARVLDAAGQVVAATRGGADAGAMEGFRVLSTQHGEYQIVVGTPLDDVDESVWVLTVGLLIAVPIASLMLAGLVWLVVGRVLRPVEDIRKQVAEISGSSLDRRVPESRTRDEIARLARTMNEMLGRLEASSERQRQFVADASHELRTPLTRIRAELEVDRAHPESADLAATHRSVLRDTDTLQRLIDDLLVLARTDSEPRPIRREPVDLDDVLLREVQQVGVPIDISGVSGAQVTGDPSHLTRVVRNLLDNAVRHGGPKVTVTLREEGEEAVLTVADDGQGIPAEFRDRIFERFARVDDARAAAEGGAGLGLAIASELVAAHGGTIVLDAPGASGTRFVVRLPTT